MTANLIIMENRKKLLVPSDELKFKKEEQYIMRKKNMWALLIMSMAVLATACGKEEISTVSQTQTSEEISTTELQTLASEEITSEVSTPDEYEPFIPNGFIEEKIQKNEFDSYEEVISYLEAGQAYTYVDVLGSDELVLLVTEATYDNQDGKNDAVSISAYVYIQNENGVTCSSMVASEDTAYPIAVKDGLLYTAGNHIVEADCISQETHAVMVKAYISEDYDENGTAHYTGFIRSGNQVYEDGKEVDDADEDHQYQALRDEYANAEIINFTVVQ